MIVLVYPQLDGVGGISRYIRSFAATYPADAPPLLILAGNPGAPVVAPANVTVEFLPVPDNRIGLVRWGRLVRRRIAELARERPLTAINLHIPPMIPVLAVPRVAPIVVTAHTTYLGMSGRFYGKQHYPSDWGRLSLAVKRWMERAIFRRADAIVTLTDQGRQEIARYGYRGAVTVLPNGVDVAQFTPGRGDAKSVDVIFAGRIETRKGSRPMVEVVKRLVAARPGIRIAIVGYGADDAYVRDQLGGLGPAVRLTGKIPFDEVAALFEGARVYASTSYYEGLPGTCIEAMAMGLPAVVWDFPFYAGLVEPATGCRVTPNEHDGFVAAVLGLLDDPARAAAMGAAGRGVVQADYDWRTLSPRIVAAIAAAAAPGATGA